jgi:hypothetical protein
MRLGNGCVSISGMELVSENTFPDREKAKGRSCVSQNRQPGCPTVSGTSCGRTKKNPWALYIPPQGSGLFYSGRDHRFFVMRFPNIDFDKFTKS